MVVARPWGKCCGNDSCRAIMENAQMRCAETLQSVLCGGDSLDEQLRITEAE